MTDYIKREDAIFIALQQPFFQNSMATEIRQIKGIDIVFCKECKYEERCRKAVEHITHEPTSVTIGCKAVDFCSYGERKNR